MQDINGFKIIGDIWINNKNCYKCIARCKVCQIEFETNYHSLIRLKSCGCARPAQLKPLSEFINGFKTIKCLGHINGSRRAIVECKVCFKEYEKEMATVKPTEISQVEAPKPAAVQPTAVPENKTQSKQDTFAEKIRKAERKAEVLQLVSIDLCRPFEKGREGETVFLQIVDMVGNGSHR